MDLVELAQFEELCQIFFTSTNTQQINDVQSQLMVLQSSVECISQCQSILNTSNSPFAHIVATNSLGNLVRNNWNNFDIEQKLNIRNFILGYIANNGTQLEEFVIPGLSNVLCKITTLGWHDDLQFRDIFSDVAQFLQVSVAHCIIGLNLFSQLVEEVNLPTSGRTTAQCRKVAIAFRDMHLLKIMELVISTMEKLKEGSINIEQIGQNHKLADVCLKLCVQCLSFDFIGTNPDESVDDVGTIQLPHSWRCLVDNNNFLSLLFDFYETYESPATSKALESLVLMASVRRSIFNSEDDRVRFLAELIKRTTQILQTQHGFDDENNYHQFCRLLGRFKTNYQLSELLRNEEFAQWLTLVTDFTCKSVENWQWASNCLHHLFGFWTRIISAVPSAASDVGKKSMRDSFEKCLSQILQSFVEVMLGSVNELVTEGESVDDPMDDDASLKAQLERIPLLVRFSYEKYAQYLLSVMDRLMEDYNGALQMMPYDMSAALIQRAEILERQQAWIVYIIGSLMSTQVWSNIQANEGEELIDANLSSRVLQLSQLTNYRMSSSQGNSKISSKLEIALIFFFKSLKKTYLFDQRVMSASNTSTSNSTITNIHPLDTINSSALSVSPPSTINSRQKVYQNFFQQMKMGSHNEVVDHILQRVENNLKYWTENEPIIGETLSIFTEFAAEFATLQSITGFETIKFFLQNHTADYFAFLREPMYDKHRMQFHTALASCVFSLSNNLVESFDVFIQPIVEILNQLLQTSDYRQNDIKRALIGASRDLRGIIEAIETPSNYNLIFETLFPNFMTIFTRAVQIWYDSPDVTTSILKFIAEFAENSTRRILFDITSPDGIIFFQQISEILVEYAKKIFPMQFSSDELYRAKYKGLSICLEILTRTLAGGYVYFGVFAIYKEDKSFENALQIVQQITLDVPLSEIFQYPKLAKAYYSHLEALFKHHITFVLELNNNMFLQFIEAINEGLQAFDSAIVACSSNCADRLASYYFLNQTRVKPPIQSLISHLQIQPTIFSGLLTTLFNQVIFGATSITFAIGRPILSVMLADEQAFVQFKNQLISTQPLPNQTRLDEAFGNLLKDIGRNLDFKNRDEFSRNLSQFRICVRSFLTT